MRRRPLAIVLALIAAPVACALGESEEPGCRGDDECDSGFVCRDGACFRFTTGQSPPNDPGADDGGDAPDDADAGGD